MKTAPIHLSVTIMDEPGIPVALVAGLPGDQGEVAFVLDGSSVRALWPARADAARRPERPLAPGGPSLASILRQAFQPAEAPHAP